MKAISSQINFGLTLCLSLNVCINNSNQVGFVCSSLHRIFFIKMNRNSKFLNKVNAKVLTAQTINGLAQIWR